MVGSFTFIYLLPLFPNSFSFSSSSNMSRKLNLISIYVLLSVQEIIEHRLNGKDYDYINQNN